MTDLPASNPGDHPEPAPGPEHRSTDPMFADQNEYGIDLSLIREQLRRTPVQRIRMGDMGRRNAELLLHYGRLHRANALRKVR